MEHFAGLTQSLMSTRSRNATHRQRCSAYVDHRGKLELFLHEIHGKHWILGIVNRAGFSCDQNRRIAAIL
jgi:hypothetical protein